MPLTPRYIANVLGLPGPQFQSDKVITDTLIDSRSHVRDSYPLFVALRSRHNDGHNYIESAKQSGCRNFIVDRIVPVRNVSETNLFVVDDTLEALRRLGAARRNDSDAQVVAITGSKGKTIVKEMIYSLIYNQKRTERSPRSFNSQIGVPLSLIKIETNTEVAIIETGISQKGEMERQEQIIRPDIVVFTPITDEHHEGFSDRGDKILEKAILAKNARIAICLSSEKQMVEALKRYNCHVIIIDADKIADFISNCRKLAVATVEILGCEVSGEANIPIALTRLNVIEGINNCKLTFDKFTQDVSSLSGTLDFIIRQCKSNLRRVLIMPTDNMLDTPDDYVDILNKNNFDHLYLIGKRQPEFTKSPKFRTERFNSVTDFLESVSPSDFYDAFIVMRGNDSDGMESIYSMLEAKQHETVLEVNLDAMISNFNFFRSKIKPSTGIIGMLKAQGYGVGSLEPARTLQKQGAAYIAVAVVDEGIELRSGGISMPVIVLNPRAQNHKLMFENKLEPAVYNFEMLEQIIHDAEKYGVENYPVHIKLETGMRRLGFVEDEIDRLGEMLANSHAVKAATIYSHLACADDPAENEYTFRQFELFDKMCSHIDDRLSYHPKRHILNSTGIVRFPEKQYDFVRLGIGLYGVPTLFDGSMSALRNVATLSSVIISIKHWKKGDTIGYNRRGLLDKDTIVATIPIGYADGLDRHLGYGKASFLVNGEWCPTIGSICMDICMIDVTNADCKVNDRVEIFGDNVPPGILADTLGTIPYEILTSISPRVKRVYYRE